VVSGWLLVISDWWSVRFTSRGPAPEAQEYDGFFR